MNDILTKEERETVERIRKRRTSKGADFENYEDVESTEDFERVFSLLDNLSKRGVKKYAIESLKDHPEYGDRLKYVSDYRHGFSDALCFLGALE